MASEIRLYAKNPGAVDVNLGRYTPRLRILDLAEFERERPVIMLRSAREPPVIMDLDSPSEIALPVVDLGKLDDEALDALVVAVDAGDHRLSIVQVENPS
jgi:hypothetical protein